MSLFFRNLFFFIIHPGLVAGLIPYYILAKKWREVFNQPLQLLEYSALILFICGFATLIACIARFATEGKGTLSPIDPTKKLVVHGLYKFSRNPMYLGVMLMLIGEAMFYRSALLWQYALLVFFAFNAFILLHEEPRLRKVFREEYRQYCSKVRRWI